MENYEIIRKTMFELAEINGYPTNPICLQEYILHYLKEIDPKNKMNSVMARNTSYVFAVLCNEFFLINQDRVPINHFFVRQERWQKMNVKQKMLESSLKILKKMLLINYRNIEHPNQPYGYIRVFEINNFRLSQIKDEIMNNTN